MVAARTPTAFLIAESGVVARTSSVQQQVMMAGITAAKTIATTGSAAIFFDTAEG
jgi:hypothetical protein